MMRFANEHLLRDLSPQVLGILVRRFRDFAACEDAVQDALASAAAQWPRAGVPDNPRAWLIRVASRRLIDHVRAEIARRRREAAVAGEALSEAEVPPPDEGEPEERDDTLLLLFMCCHPSLTRASAIALTLRAVAGLTTAEIARAFFVPEATMAQRILRAKQTIKQSGVQFRMPATQERAERLGSVLHVLYLIVNEGYASSAGPELQRVDLSREAIRLARAVERLAPDDAEVTGLLALMLLTDARRDARSGPRGELIPLDEQDRARWDRAAIREGVTLVTAALSRGAVGPYQLQAAIAAVHDEAERAEATDWPQVLALYGLLLHERQPDGRAQPCDRGRDGAGAGARARAARAPGPRRANGKPLPLARRARTLVRTRGRCRKSGGALSRSGQPHGKHSRARLSTREGGPVDSCSP